MDTRQYIAEHLQEDVHDLALRNTDARVDKALALRQIEARQLLRDKVPSWSDNDELLFPVRLSIEQCSSESTARYKASLMHGGSFADLTGGLGIDCYFLSQGFSVANYVEQNEELCALARHNFEVLGHGETVCPISVHHESAECFLQHSEEVDAVFVDPARRDGQGRKVVSIADCSPNLLEIQDLMLQKASRALVKLSPMLDIHQALRQLHHVKEVHVVAVENECKELLFLMERDYAEAPMFVAVNLGTNQPEVRWTQGLPQEVQGFSPAVGAYLYEPNAALMKAGCFHVLAEQYGVSQLHRNSHLYTADQMVLDFPGRIFVVEGWAPYNKRIKQTLLVDVEKASIAARNFPLSVAELRKVLKIADGDTVYLFATTVGENRKVIIRTTKVQPHL